MGAYATGGYFALQEAIAHLRSRRLKIDGWMPVAAIGAAILGACAVLLYLFSLVQAGTHVFMPNRLDGSLLRPAIFNTLTIDYIQIRIIRIGGRANG